MIRYCIKLLHVKKSLILFSTGLLLTIILYSCGIDSIYENTSDIPKGKWDKNTSVSFVVPITDTIKSCNIIFSIRNNNNYPYSNIFLFVDTRSPLGKTLRDTVEIELCDAKGKWLGKGIGGLWQNKFYFRKNIRFPYSGNYVFKVTQAMREDRLEGIIDLGIKAEYYKQ